MYMAEGWAQYGHTLEINVTASIKCCTKRIEVDVRLDNDKWDLPDHFALHWKVCIMDTYRPTNDFLSADGKSKLLLKVFLFKQGITLKEWIGRG